MKTRFLTKNWIADIYNRLSDDDETEGLSESCENQDAINRNYAKKENIVVYESRTDDGFTGTNFNRPRFKLMKDDIDNKTINCIIVKDLSRLGRHPYLVGMFLEGIDLKGIRFISVNDRIDTLYEEINYIEVACKNLINGLYPVMISNAVKMTWEMMADKGWYFAPFPPYGYLKDPNDIHHLILDPYASKIVKRIHDMYYYDKFGYAKIAEILKQENIVCPSYYLKSIFPNFHIPSFPDMEKRGLYGWTIHGVRNILRNQVYCGDILNCKTRSAGIKSNKKIKNAPENIVIRSDKHTAIVPRCQFEEIQKMMEEKARVCKTGNRHIFSGLLRCPDCGASLNQIGGKYKSFSCATYKDYGSNYCTTHAISKNNLIQLVALDINDKVRAIKLDESNFIKKLIKIEDDVLHKNIKDAERRLLEIEKRLKELHRIEDNLYEDKALDIIPLDQYKRLSEKYSSERHSLQDERMIKRDFITKSENENKAAYNFIEVLKKYENITPEVLDTVILNQLIDKIEVHQLQVSPTGVKTQRVDIYYKGVGVIKPEKAINEMPHIITHQSNHIYANV